MAVLQDLAVSTSQLQVREPILSDVQLDFLSELYAASISSSLQQKSKSVHTMRSAKAPYFGGLDGTTM
jgi:hypothetical protein